MKGIYWQQLILIPVCFSDCPKCCLCTSIIKSSLFLLLLCRQIQNLVTDTDEWSPCLPGHSLTGLILSHLFLTDWGGWVGGNWLVPLKIHQFCFLSMELQAIPLCAVPFSYYCTTKLFDTSVELSTQSRKWQVNFTFQLSQHFGGLGGRWGSNDCRANKRRTEQWVGFCGNIFQADAVLQDVIMVQVSESEIDDLFQAPEMGSSLTKISANS